jgi:hypothetical protein
VFRYQPIIVKDEVYYPLSTIAEAYCLDERFLLNLVRETGEYYRCVERDDLLIPYSVYESLRLPFERCSLHFIYGYARMNHLIREIRRDTEFDYDERDDYYG